MAELEYEGSLTALEDAVIWIDSISVANATTDNVCEEVGCKLKLLISARLLRTVADEKVRKFVDKVVVEEWLLNSAELCEIVAGKDADKLRDKAAVNGNKICTVEVGVALADNRVEVAVEKTAELTKEVADMSVVEEAIECTINIVEGVVEESGVEIAADCSVEVMDGMTGTEKVARIIESIIVDKVAITEDDVGTALDETADPKDEARIVDKTVAIEDGIGTALEERLSALIISAAFASIFNLCSY